MPCGLTGKTAVAGKWCVSHKFRPKWINVIQIFLLDNKEIRWRNPVTLGSDVVCSRCLPDALRLLAATGIVGEIHVERHHVDHNLHTAHDDLQ